MKTISVILTLVLALGLVSPAPVQAQVSLNPAGQILYYTNTLASARAYATNTTDTLPNTAINKWFQASPQSTTLGGASFVSLQIATLDSAYIYVYIDELIGSTWTAVVTDSLEQDAAYTQEFAVRSQNSEATAKLGGKFRVRLNFQNVTQGTTTATYTAKWLWKP